jgi:hypothetical protein
MDKIQKKTRLPIQLQLCKFTARECAVSSVVEHYLDTVGVTGSKPVSRTIFRPANLPKKKAQKLFASAPFEPFHG